jgi:hypothetical protein
MKLSKVFIIVLLCLGLAPAVFTQKCFSELLVESSSSLQFYNPTTP